MNITKELKYQCNKTRDRILFYTFWIHRHFINKQPLTNTILIIRLDAIGDCIIWLDQAKEYRKVFPEHRIVLLHNQAWTEIANRLPWFDECIPFDRNKVGDMDYYRKLIVTLNKYNYEKVFSPVFSRDFFTVDWIVHNINAQDKIGYQGDYQNNKGLANLNLYVQKKYDKLHLKERADRWYTYLVPNDRKCVMELQRNANFVRKTINPNFRSSLPLIPFEVQKINSLSSSEYAVFFLGASNTFRMWPISSFVKIVKYIPYNTIVLCGSSKEKYLADSFLSDYKGDKTIVDLIGKTSLINLINVISAANILLSNETSASHIAVATRTPSICLLGGGHYGRFHPYQTETTDIKDEKIKPTVITAHDRTCFLCNWICTKPLQNNRWKCVDDIQVDDVIKAIHNTCNSFSL